MNESRFSFVYVMSAIGIMLVAGAAGFGIGWYRGSHTTAGELEGTIRELTVRNNELEIKSGELNDGLSELSKSIDKPVKSIADAISKLKEVKQRVEILEHRLGRGGDSIDDRSDL